MGKGDGNDQGQHEPAPPFVGSLRDDDWSASSYCREHLSACGVVQLGIAKQKTKRYKRRAPLGLDGQWEVRAVRVGHRKGFDLEQGIALKLREGRGSLSAVQLVANKSDDFAFADSTSVIAVAGGGGAVTVVVVLQQRTPVCAISFKPLNKPTDLYRLNVGIIPVGEDAVWTAFAARNNLDPSKIHMVMMDGPSLLPALVSTRGPEVCGRPPPAPYWPGTAFRSVARSMPTEILTLRLSLI